MSVLCKVGRAHTEGLPAEDQAVLGVWVDTGLVDGQPVPATVMAAALTANGHPVGVTTVKDHRGRRCVCFRQATLRRPSE